MSGTSSNSTTSTLTVDKMEAIHHFIRRSGYSALSETGKEIVEILTIQQAAALAAVRRLTRHQPEGILHGTLAHEMRLTPSAITRLVEPLVNAGMLERNPSAQDRRRVLLTLTATGLEYAERVEQGMFHAIHLLSVDLTEEEKAVYSGIVDKLYAALERLSPPAPQS